MVARAVRAPVAIAFDVGGTKILAGTVDREGRILTQHEVGTPTDSGEAVVSALDELAEALWDDRIAAVGYGIPANLERRTRVAQGAANLPLVGIDLLSHGRERFGLPTGVENDGNAATLAEWKLGAGRGAENLVCLTLGTGVGGGLVLDGRLFTGWAELGHIVIQEGGPECSCGGRGHLEALASGPAGDRAGRELYGGDADAHFLIGRAKDGDEAGVATLARIGESLGAGVGSLVNVFDPDVVVVGGGFGAAAGDLLLGPARDAARREALSAAADRLRLVPAELGIEAGLVGAALVAFAVLDGVE
jgi:glucokinase